MGKKVSITDEKSTDDLSQELMVESDIDSYIPVFDS